MKMVVIKNLFAFITIILIDLFACQKKHTEVKSTENVQADTLVIKPQYNNSSSGVDKDVTISATGTIVFRINNKENVWRGYLVIDNIKDTLSSSPILVAGQPFYNVLFTGHTSTMTLIVNADGGNVQDFLPRMNAGNTQQ